MGRLGDRFSPNIRLAHVKRKLTPGRVLYILCDFTNPPKPKYLVLVCPDTQPRPLLFVVNSRISDYLRKRPYLLACQVTLRAADYDWLRHDSYIDCSNVIENLELATITSQMVNDTNCIKGELNADTCSQIVAAVQAAKTITRKHKRVIVGALAPQVGSRP